MQKQIFLGTQSSGWGLWKLGVELPPNSSLRFRV